MKIFKLILMIGVVLISTNCAYNGINQIPIPPTVTKADLGSPFPLEAGLLISEKDKEQIFQSQSLPDIQNEYHLNILEPYRLPVGQAFEEASVNIFSQIFQKIHLIRSLEEGKNYPLIIEPKLTGFDFRLIYSSYPSLWRYNVVILARSQVKVFCSLITQNRIIWQNSVSTPVIFQDWFDDYQLGKNVGDIASETITKALEELASKMTEGSRKPQAVHGWLQEVNPVK
jgi:hypothetical protein